MADLDSANIATRAKMIHWYDPSKAQ